MLSSGMDKTQPNRLMTRAEVSRRVSLGRSALYAAMARGEFPRPYRLPSTAVRRSEREIEKWISTLQKSNGGRGKRAA